MVNPQKRANGILQQLSLKEKISLMSGNKTAFVLFLENYVHGKITTKVETGKTEQLPSLTIGYGHRGVVELGCTGIPNILARGASWDVEMEGRLGELLGKEARAQEINTVIGVSANLLQCPYERASQNTYGEDGFLVGEMGAALTQGIQKHNVIAVGESFVQIQENPKKGTEIIYDEKTLQEVYLPQFKKLIDAKIGALMISPHVLRKTTDQKLIKKILLGDFGFSGITITEGLDKNTEEYLDQGITFEFPKTKAFGKTLFRAVRSGQISEETLDETVLRIIKTILKYIDKEDRFSYDKEMVGSEDHKQLNLEAAEQSLVLVKNDGVLPIDTKQITNITIIGAPATEQESKDSYFVPGPSPLEAITSNLSPHIKVQHITKLSNRAVRTAEKSDAAIIFVSGDGSKDSQGDGHYIRRMAQLQPYLAVVCLGTLPSSFEQWHHNVPSILWSGSKGTQRGLAIARALLGFFSPGGKLPFCIMSHEVANQKEIKTHLTESLPSLRGYTLLDAYNQQALYPFGHGESYTLFELGEATSIFMGDAIMIEVPITNSGEFKGDEVIQVYVSQQRDEEPSLNKRLKGFQRISLEPGESTSAAIVVHLDDISSYDPEQGEWVFEPGEYQFLVGTSSHEEKLQTLVVELD